MKKEISYMEMAVMNTAGEEQEVCNNILKVLDQKRKLNKIRVTALKVGTWVALASFIIGTCFIKEFTVPVILSVAGASWMALIAFANSKLRFKRKNLLTLRPKRNKIKIERW